MLTEILASGNQPGPTGSQPTPVRRRRAHPASQVWPFASGLPPGESTGASLDAATFAGERRGTGAAGQQHPAREVCVRAAARGRLQSLLVWTGLSAAALFCASSPSEGVPRFFISAGVWVKPSLPQPDKPWKPTSFLCRTGWVQEQPCPLPTHQHGPAWPTPSPCPNSPSYFSLCSLSRIKAASPPCITNIIQLLDKKLSGSSLLIPLEAERRQRERTRCGQDRD